VIKLAVPPDKALAKLKEVGLYDPLVAVVGEQFFSKCLHGISAQRVSEDDRCALVFAALRSIKCVRGNPAASLEGLGESAPLNKRWEGVTNASTALFLERLSPQEIIAGLREILKKRP